jgi:putative transposase
MKFNEPGLSHVYNRGNNKQNVFFSRDNYGYFLEKCHRYLKPFSDILAWCLMTNHFHFLLHITQKGLVPVTCGGITMPSITNGFRLLQSSYAKGINKRMNRTGNLFQQKTKAKQVNIDDRQAMNTFHYIHQNPVKAGIVNLPERWEYSSFRDYLGLRSGTLCNQEIAIQLLGIDVLNLRMDTAREIETREISQLYLPEDIEYMLRFL